MIDFSFSRRTKHHIRTSVYQPSGNLCSLSSFSRLRQIHHAANQKSETVPHTRGPASQSGISSVPGQRTKILVEDNGSSRQSDSSHKPIIIASPTSQIQAARGDQIPWQGRWQSLCPISTDSVRRSSTSPIPRSNCKCNRHSSAV